MKKIQIRVFKDGHIESETIGMKGKSCEKYVEIIEDLTGAQTVKSNYTEEFYEKDSSQTITNRGTQFNED